MCSRQHSWGNNKSCHPWDCRYYQDNFGLFDVKLFKVLPQSTWVQYISSCLLPSLSTFSLQGMCSLLTTTHLTVTVPHWVQLYCPIVLKCKLWQFEQILIDGSILAWSNFSVMIRIVKWYFSTTKKLNKNIWPFKCFCGKNWVSHVIKNVTWQVKMKVRKLYQ